MLNYDTTMSMVLINELGLQKKTLSYQIETLKIEIASALHDRDKALKECNDLREKFGGYTSKEESNRESLKSRLEYDIYNRERYVLLNLIKNLRNYFIFTKKCLTKIIIINFSICLLKLCLY